MKKLILSILIITLALSLSIPTYCDDEIDIDAPVGKVLFPTIEAISIEDFSAKLNSLNSRDIQIDYDSQQIPDIYERVLERIDSDKDIVYIPDIDLTGVLFNMYVKPCNVDYKTNGFPKYGTAFIEGDEVGLQTSLTFYYENSEYDYYGHMISTSIANKEIILHGKKISYNNETNKTLIYFESDGEMLYVVSMPLTDDEIKALPRGMFYPKAISITDIKNGDFSAISGSIDIDVDDPKESYDVECIIG